MEKENIVRNGVKYIGFDFSTKVAGHPVHENFFPKDFSKETKRTIENNRIV